MHCRFARPLGQGKPGVGWWGAAATHLHLHVILADRNDVRGILVTLPVKKYQRITHSFSQYLGNMMGGIATKLGLTILVELRVDVDSYIAHAAIVLQVAESDKLPHNNEAYPVIK